MKPLILALLLLFSPAVLKAQSGDPLKDLQMVVLGIPQEDLKVKIKGFRNSKRFSVNYDKFKDESWIDVGPFFVGGNSRYITSGASINMTVRLRYPSARLNAPPKNYVLWFQASGREWAFLKHRELNILIDGERVNLGEGKWDGEARRGTFESLGFLVPAEVFEKMANAQKCDLQVGTFELTLKDEHKEAFRDLFSLTK